MKRITVLMAILSIILYAGDDCTEEKLIIKPYGYFKLDMSYNSDLISAGNFARWAILNRGEAIPTTHITSNESRLGFLINKGDISGKMEVDFFGIGGGENKPGLMVRKAYIQAKFENFILRVGQDSDVVSPLVPSTINYTVNWWAGDIGYRRPMLNLFNSNSGLTWTFAIARNIGGDIDKDGIDDGTAAVIPEFQGRLAFKLFGNHTVGFSGHYAIREIAENSSYKAWSSNIDINSRISNYITLNGNLYVGSNVASMLGGIGNTSTLEGVDTQGGWINLKIKPNSKTSISTGFSMDDPCDCDLEDGMRSKNTTIFANVYQDILQGFKVGFEVSNWTTEYKNIDTANAVRGQLAFLYNF